MTTDRLLCATSAARPRSSSTRKLSSARPYGENDWVEDYIAQVDGEPIGCVVLVIRDAAGKTKHVVASYRPRSSVMLFSRLLGEKFAGTPIAEHFASNGD